MKKYLIALALFAIPAAMAADQKDSSQGEKDTPPALAAVVTTPAPSLIAAGHQHNRDDLISSSSVPASRQLPQRIDADRALADRMQDPQNVHKVGGLLGTGFFGTPTLTPQALEVAFRAVTSDHNALIDRLGTLEESLRGVGAVQRALAESQKREEETRAQLKESQNALQAEQALTKLMKTRQSALLSEAKLKDANSALDKARLEELARERAALKTLVSEYEKNVAEIERLVQENADREASLPPPQSSGSETSKPDESIERLRASILEVMANNREKIATLTAKNALLEREKNETEARVDLLQSAVKAHDHYTIILEMIHDKEISDKKLALHIFSVKNVIGKNLDELSEGREKRLIEAIILISRPYAQRPKKGEFTYDYDAKGCWRHLGNLFVKNGLAWEGPSLDLTKCTYDKSTFKNKAESLAENDDLVTQ